MNALYLSALDCSSELIGLRKGIRGRYFLKVKKDGDFIQYFKLELFKNGKVNQYADFGDILPTVYIQTKLHTVYAEGRFMSITEHKGEIAYNFRWNGGRLFIRERGDWKPAKGGLE